MTLINSSIGRVQTPSHRPALPQIRQAPLGAPVRDANTAQSAAAAPPIDLAKVAALQNALARGEYAIDPAAVARAIIAALELIGGDPS